MLLIWNFAKVLVELLIRFRFLCLLLLRLFINDFAHIIMYVVFVFSGKELILILAFRHHFLLLVPLGFFLLGSFLVGHLIISTFIHIDRLLLRLIDEVENVFLLGLSLFGWLIARFAFICGGLVCCSVIGIFLFFSLT